MSFYVSVYNTLGEETSRLELPEAVEYSSGRTSKGESGRYYKGAGVSYSSHSVLKPEGYINVRLNPVFYYGYTVEKEIWKGKTGIFQEKCQPFFSDFIGSCGPKELKIINNSKEFKRSAIKVVDCIEYDPINNQRYFILEYEKGGRTSWIKDIGKVKVLLGLLEYMLQNDWNFPWDKGAIGDVGAFGNVHDVADMFKSSDFSHKLGTVYAILYSMRAKSKNRYYEFITTAGYKHTDNRDFVIIALAIITRFGVDIQQGFPKEAKDNWEVYYHLVGNCLITGRNCGYVEDVVNGEAIRQQYIDRFFMTIPKEADKIKGFVV
jgi:hypothetical protein